MRKGKGYKIDKGGKKVRSTTRVITRAGTLVSMMEVMEQGAVNGTGQGKGQRQAQGRGEEQAQVNWRTRARTNRMAMASKYKVVYAVAKA